MYENIKSSLAFVIYDPSECLWRCAFKFLDRNDINDPAIFTVESFRRWFIEYYKDQFWKDEFIGWKYEIEELHKQVQLAIEAGADRIIILDQRDPIEDV